MNKKMVIKSSLVAVVLAGVCGSAFAAGPEEPTKLPSMIGTGQVKFVGAVVDSPCNLDAGSVDQTIQMGVLSLTSLTGNKTKAQPFDIKLTQCSATTAQSAVVTFTGAPDSNTATDLSTGLDNVAIQLSTYDGNAISLGTALPAKAITDGDNDLRFLAKAVKTGADADKIQVGDFVAVSQFSVAYQ